MKKARDAGYRLSDIMQSCSELLRRHKGRALYAYISCLIKKSLDWASIRQKVERSQYKKQFIEQQVQLRRQRQVDLTFKLNALQGKLLADGKALYQFEADTVFRADYSSGTLRSGALPCASAVALIKRATSGKLVPPSLLKETTECAFQTWVSTISSSEKRTLLPRHVFCQPANTQNAYLRLHFLMKDKVNRIPDTLPTQRSFIQLKSLLQGNAQSHLAPA